MSKFIDELHNQEDANTLGSGVLSFLILVFCLLVIGVLFWAGV